MSNRRVLIVDQDPLILESAAAVLQSLSIEVVSAESALAAVEALEATRDGSKEGFDVAVLHMNLPDGSALPFSEILRMAAPGCRMIATTGLPSPQLLAVAQSLGCDTLVSRAGDSRDLVDAVSSALAAPDAAPRDVAPITTSSRPRILSVDDDELVSYTLEAVLSESTIFRAVHRPADAFSALTESSFDILLADMKMPEMDGLTLIRKARAIQPELAPIVITGFPEMATVIEAFKIGAYDYLIKPFDPDLLALVVMRTWERLRLDRKRGFLFRQLQTALLDQQTTMRYAEAVIESFVGPLVIVDVHGGIQRVNDAAASLLGYPEAEIVGRRVGFVFGEDEKVASPTLAWMLDQGTVRNHQMSYKAKDGRELRMNVNATVVRDESGQALGVVLGAKDLSNLPKLAQLLDERKRALKASVE